MIMVQSYSFSAKQRTLFCYYFSNNFVLVQLTSTAHNARENTAAADAQTASREVVGRLLVCADRRDTNLLCLYSGMD
jgi:hypothetical protein